MARHNDILTQFREIIPIFDYKNNSHKNLVSKNREWNLTLVRVERRAANNRAWYEYLSTAEMFIHVVTRVPTKLLPWKLFFVRLPTERLIDDLLHLTSTQSSTFFPFFFLLLLLVTLNFATKRRKWRQVMRLNENNAQTWAKLLTTFNAKRAFTN